MLVRVLVVVCVSLFFAFCAFFICSVFFFFSLIACKPVKSIMNAKTPVYLVCRVFLFLCFFFVDNFIVCLMMQANDKLSGYKTHSARVTVKQKDQQNDLVFLSPPPIRLILHQNTIAIESGSARPVRKRTIELIQHSRVGKQV